jgi:hypothetical protein
MIIYLMLDKNKSYTILYLSINVNVVIANHLYL